MEFNKMQARKSSRKENVFVIDNELSICRIITSLSKKLNKDIKIQEADISNIEIHEYETIIDYDEGLIKLLKENYLVFYDNWGDLRRSRRKEPQPIPVEGYTGYFWCWHVHDKTRVPLARLIWSYKHNKEIPHNHVIDHGNDMKFLNILSNLSLLKQQQNISKLRYPKRVVEPYSVTMISHPLGLPIKLLRFKDNSKLEQELIIYNTENNIQPILDDLNSFKQIVDVDAEKFKQHFENLKMTSISYIAYTKQRTTGDSFTDEIFSQSIDWQNVNEIVRIERFMPLVS